MQLTMYFYRRTWIYGFVFPNYEDVKLIKVKYDGKVYDHIKHERVVYVMELVCKWYCFSALHAWIVHNCANDMDECQEIYVSSERLEQILEILKQVKSLLDQSELYQKECYGPVFKCEEDVRFLLSPMEGQFGDFGSQQIDEDYQKNVQKAIIIFEELLGDVQKHGHVAGGFFYQADW